MNAPARDPVPAAPLRQHLPIETPEHVAVHLELAGVGSRAAAALLDTLLVTLALLVLRVLAGALGLGEIGSALEGWALAVLILLSFLTFFGYFALYEALNGGRTPGKQALGLRVVMETGHPVTPTAAVVRNLVRLLDCYFPLLPFLPGLVMVFLHRRNQRLGDLAAGTIVVRDRPVDWGLGPAPPREAPAEEPIETGPPELSEDEFRLLDQFLARADQLDPAVQVRLATDLSRRFQDRIPRRTEDPDSFLTALHAEEQRKRRGRFATRAQTGTAGRTIVTAERFVAKKRDSWETFHVIAARVERAGVGALTPGEIPGFAARYREIAADLARARTYGVDPRVIEYLERVVSAGHNALYRARGRRRTPVLRYLLRDFPAAVVQSWRYVLAALLLFAIPAIIGYVMIRGRPELADEVLSPVMVSRAEQAADRQARGIGYAQSRGETLPVLASAIMANNIGVAFWAFVGGMLAGTLTAFVLVMNGLSLGLGFGLFVNYHAGGYLATFVAGHGVLELTAIFVAAGAGFRLAGALILPGDRTRKDALVVEGRIAARMIGAVVSMLALAGVIEGLLSASDAPAALKYVVSATTAALLVLYLRNGYVSLKPATG
ncbi:MAG TPA: stage II sporulation protein M [Gemmatimonadales bacterium]|nr:stage II sporulation protein M [Gemmatimonadales bacterium]